MDTIDNNGRQCSKNSPAYSFRAVQVLAIAPNYMTFISTGANNASLKCIFHTIILTMF